MIAVLSAVVAMGLWVFRREIGRNDKAHGELESKIDKTRDELRAEIKAVEADVKQLLAGQSRIEGLLEGVLGKRPNAATPSPADAST